MIIKTRAIVIKEQTVGESDRLITLLTEHEGVIRAFAKRAKNYKDSKHSSTGLLCYSDFSIFKGRDKYIVDSSKPIDVFFGLRSDIKALSLAQYFCELCAIFIPEETDSSLFLRLVLNSIHFLSKGEKDIMMIKAVTELRMLSESGYMPDLVACSECLSYEGESWYFSPIKGSITCQNCLKGDTYGLIPLSPSALTAMRHIIYSEFKKIYSFRLHSNALINLCKASEDYAVHIIGRTPLTLSFFNDIY